MRRTVFALLLVASATSPAKAGPALDLVSAARSQVGTTLYYDPSYQRIAYPMGDVPPERGVCSDVVVRAFRDVGIDLQAEVHGDMKRHFAAYPRIWGLQKTDANIDHRRVPNLATWLRRRGMSRPVPPDAAGWQPGDIFTSLVDGRSTHIGFVSDRVGPRGPLIVHNIGLGVHEEDGLLASPITGRFRWSVDQGPACGSAETQARRRSASGCGFDSAMR